MTQNDVVSTERLAEMLADAKSEADRRPRDETIYDFEPEEVVKALTELLSRRSTDGEAEFVQRWNDHFGGEAARAEAALSSIPTEPVAAPSGPVVSVKALDEAIPPYLIDQLQYVDAAQEPSAATALCRDAAKALSAIAALSIEVSL